MYDMIFVDFLISIMNNKQLICIDLTYITTSNNTWLKIDLRKYYNCNIGLVNLLQRSGLLQSLLKRKRGWEKRMGNVHNSSVKNLQMSGVKKDFKCQKQKKRLQMSEAKKASSVRSRLDPNTALQKVHQ